MPVLHLHPTKLQQEAERIAAVLHASTEVSEPASTTTHTHTTITHRKTLMSKLKKNRKPAKAAYATIFCLVGFSILGTRWTRITTETAPAASTTCKRTNERT